MSSSKQGSFNSQRLFNNITNIHSSFHFEPWDPLNDNLPFKQDYLYFMSPPDLQIKKPVSTQVSSSKKVTFSQCDEMLDPISKDTYINSDLVPGLRAHSFKSFINKCEAVLVMFYDPWSPVCDWGKRHFLQAARTTRRANHAYAAVDCSTEKWLCADEDVTSLPVFKLYSNGHTVDTIKDPLNFKQNLMRQYVESSPIFLPQKSPSCLKSNKSTDEVNTTLQVHDYSYFNSTAQRCSQNKEFNIEVLLNQLSE